MGRTARCEGCGVVFRVLGGRQVARCPGCGRLVDLDATPIVPGLNGKAPPRTLARYRCLECAQDYEAALGPREMPRCPACLCRHATALSPVVRVASFARTRGSPSRNGSRLEGKRARGQRRWEENARELGDLLTASDRLLRALALGEEAMVRWEAGMTRLNDAITRRREERQGKDEG